MMTARVAGGTAIRLRSVSFMRLLGVLRNVRTTVCRPVSVPQEASIVFPKVVVPFIIEEVADS